MGLPYSVTFVDRGFSRYLAVLFSWRVLDFSFSSFLHSVINPRPPSVAISVQLWAPRAACFQFCWILKDRTSLSTHVAHSFSCTSLLDGLALFVHSWGVSLELSPFCVK